MVALRSLGTGQRIPSRPCPDLVLELHAQITSGSTISATYFQNAPFGGSGAVTITTNSSTTIAGSFTFTAKNLLGSGDITISSSFNISKT